MFTGLKHGAVIGGSMVLVGAYNPLRQMGMMGSLATIGIGAIVAGYLGKDNWLVKDVGIGIVAGEVAGLVGGYLTGA